MTPAMRLGRSCRWMFQMFLYRHRICRSRDDLEPVLKVESMRMAEGKTRVFHGSWFASGSKRKVGVMRTP